MKPYTPALETDADIEKTAADWVTRCDAGLTSAEQQIFQDWLAADARHADAFDRLSEAWSVFDRVQEGGALSAVLAGLAERARQRRRRRFQTAAVVAVLVVTGLWPGKFVRPSGQTATESAPVAQAPAPIDDRIRRLPDGTVVELKAGAEIAVRYEAEARRVTLLKGEAFFRVAKDKNRPFFVETNGVTVRAVGTAFSVQTQPQAVEVVVAEGSVDVGRSTAATSDNNPIRLAAGQKVIIRALLLRPATRIANAAPANASPSVPTAPTAPPPAMSMPAVENLSTGDLEQRLAWRDTRLVFSGTTLSDAVALLNRQNITQIVIPDPAVGQLRIDGYFRSDNPEGFVRIVAGTFEGQLTAEPLDEHTIALRARP